MTILEVKKLSKEYGGKQKYQALKSINFSVEKGEFIAIMGPSGSGKTTLLNILSSIDTVYSGYVKILDKEINRLNNKELSKFRKKHLGFIFQDYSVLPTLTVKENIMLPLSVQKLSRHEIDQNYKEISKVLNIESLGNKYPGEISGGQQQRTAAARAFVHKPTIIFADEPTGALDSKSAQDLLQRLESMNKQLNTTIIMVTHDPSAASFSERVILLKDGDIYSEIHRNNSSKSAFYQNIIKRQTIMEGINYDI